MSERAQQTGGAQREELTRQSAMPTLQRFLSGITSPIRGSRRSAEPLPPVPQIDLTMEDTEQAEEEFFPEEMMTAREPPGEARNSRLERENSYSTNIENWTEKQLEFQLYIRGLDVFDQRFKSRYFNRGSSKRETCMGIVNRLIEDGTWKRRIEEQLLQSRIGEYRDINRRRGSRD